MSESLNPKPIIVIVTLALMLAGTMIPANANASDPLQQAGNSELGKITSFLKVMENYIRITKEFYGIANDKERAAAFAVMEIKSVYERSGNRQGAIKELTGLLVKTNNRTIRNIIRFQLLDLYKQSNDTPSAMENLRAIIQENLN